VAGANVLDVTIRVQPSIVDLALIVCERFADIFTICTDMGKFPLSLLSLVPFRQSSHLGSGDSVEAITFARRIPRFLNTSIDSM
jgi:hypothetical protein